MGVYRGIMLWPLLQSLCRIHVLLGFPEILSAAYMDWGGEG